MIKVKSIYEKAASTDGKRYLVDLFWPEGLHTRAAKVDEWLRQIGPDYDLQRFEFDKQNWETYREKYEKHVWDAAEKKVLLERLADESKKNPVTLLYGNRDAQHNHALVLKQLIEERLL